MPEIPIPLRELLAFAQTDKAPLCSVKFCRNRRAPGRSICYRHNQAAWRMRNPVRSAWCALRDHARQRGIEFALAFEHFREICELTGYHRGKGQAGHSLSIDRLDSRTGYELANVRVITLSENGRKGSLHDKIMLQGGESVHWKILSVPRTEEFEAERRKGFVGYFQQPQPIAADLHEEEELPAWLQSKAA